jgi:hypothetical protein
MVNPEIAATFDEVVFVQSEHGQCRVTDYYNTLFDEAIYGDFKKKYPRAAKKKRIQKKWHNRILREMKKAEARIERDFRLHSRVWKEVSMGDLMKMEREALDEVLAGGIVVRAPSLGGLDVNG